MSEAHNHSEAYLEGFRASADAVNPYTHPDDEHDRKDWNVGRLDRATADATDHRMPS